MSTNRSVGRSAATQVRPKSPVSARIRNPSQPHNRPTPPRIVIPNPPHGGRNLLLQTRHSPRPQTPAPQSVPPGFGTPANWDVLIPPKPRRGFTPHWHLE